jgi:MFS family permease
MLALFVATLVIVQLSMRFGARRLISGGFIVIALGMAALVFLQPQTPFWLLILPLLVMGFGLGVATVARTVVVLNAPPPGLTGMAAGINSAADQSGFTAGIILSSALVTYFADQHFRQTLALLDTPPEIVQLAVLAFQKTFAIVLSADYNNVPASVQEHVTALFDQAFTFGLGQTFLAIAVFIALAGVVIFFGMSKGLKASFIDPLDQPSGAPAAPAIQPTDSGSPAIQ